MRLVIFSLICYFAFATTVYAEKRVALVIGNSLYKHVTKLRNPVNDATLMAETLKKLNFEVISATDLTQKEMKRNIAEFTGKLRKYGENTVGLVYYAGHGLQVQGLNYLVPIDAKINAEADVAIETISANDMLYALNQSGNRTNIIIFDACRDNPFRSLFRSGAKGLATMNAPKGSLIAFATAPGSVAADGKSTNSPFTKAIAKHLLTPGITIERVLKRVGKDVQKHTKEQQRPWWNRDIYDDLYLLGKQEIASNTIAKGGLAAAEEQKKNAKKRIAAAPDNNTIFVDSFDDEAKNKLWTVYGLDKQSSLTQDGVHYLISNSETQLYSTGKSAKNIFALNDQKLKGNWDMSIDIVLEPGVEQYDIQLGIKDKNSAIYARVSKENSSGLGGRCHQFYVSMHKTGNAAANRWNILYDSERCFYSSNGKHGKYKNADFFAKTRLLEAAPMTLTLSKRKFSYYATLTSKALSEPKTTRPLKVFRVKGVPAYTLGTAGGGQTSAEIHEFRIKRAH